MCRRKSPGIPWQPRSKEREQSCSARSLLQEPALPAEQTHPESRGLSSRLPRPDHREARCLPWSKRGGASAGPPANSSHTASASVPEDRGSP